MDTESTETKTCVICFEPATDEAPLCEECQGELTVLDSTYDRIFWENV